MTSTNFNIGITETSRSSSRVLKPPGGGHSDIFGIYTGEEARTPKAKNYQKSSISEVFGSSEPLTISKKEEIKPLPEMIIAVDNKELDANVNERENEAPKPLTTPQRTRVPPGGFSSGLW